jgi:hypothetical protein
MFRRFKLLACVRDVISNYCPPTSAVLSCSKSRPVSEAGIFSYLVSDGVLLHHAAHRHARSSSLAAVAGAGALDIGDSALELGRHSAVPGVSGEARSTLSSHLGSWAAADIAKRPPHVRSLPSAMRARQVV